MAKFSNRDNVSGRFAKMGTSAGEGFVNASADDTRLGMERPRHGPSTDAEHEPAGHRSAVEIDARSGEQLGNQISKPIDPQARRTVAAAGDSAHLRFLTAGE